MERLTDPERELVDYQEASRMTHLSVGTLKRYRCEKRITWPVYRIGGRPHFRREDVLEYVESCLEEPVQQ